MGTAPPVAPRPEPPGLPDRGGETAPEFVDSPRSPPGNDLGADADEPARFPADEFDSPSAHLDPVAELRRQDFVLAAVLCPVQRQLRACQSHAQGVDGARCLLPVTPRTAE